MSRSTLTSKGQITLPRAIREHFQLKAGDRVDFLIGADGTVTVCPADAEVTSLKGIVPRPSRPVSLEEMDDAIRNRRR